MNTEIADILKGYIKDLPWVERISGLVRPVVRIDVVDIGNDQEVTVRKVFPVACDVTHAECVEQSSKYLDLVPDSDKRSILYFEDRGIVTLGRVGKLLQFRSGLRLVGWLNMEMFDTSECTISAPVIASILTSLPSDYFNSSPYQRLQVNVSGIQPKTPDIFASYTYSEETNQYLLYPYDYFALNIDTEFSVHESCIDDIEIKTKEC